MQRFDFKDTVRVNIAGLEYTLQADEVLRDYLGEAEKELAAMAEAVQRSEKTEGDALSLCRMVLDEILGFAATASIFQGRRQNIADYADIILFLGAEIRAAKPKKAKK